MEPSQSLTWFTWKWHQKEEEIPILETIIFRFHVKLGERILSGMFTKKRMLYSMGTIQSHGIGGHPGCSCRDARECGQVADSHLERIWKVGRTHPIQKGFWRKFELGLVWDGRTLFHSMQLGSRNTQEESFFKDILLRVDLLKPWITSESCFNKEIRCFCFVPSNVWVDNIFLFPFGGMWHRFSYA